MPTLESCGSMLFYGSIGTGTPVLLVHSTACTGGLWRGLIKALGDGFTFYTPDLAGYGRSACDYLTDKSTLRDQADFIAPLLWDRPEPFHLIGHSFGGAVALAAAIAWPERVRSLTLYEPTCFSLLRGGGADNHLQFEAISRVPDDMRRFIAEGAQDRAMGRFIDFWNGTSVWDRMRAADRAHLAPLASKVVDDFRLLFDEAWPTDRFSRLPYPVTILRGETSPAPALRVAELLARLIPTARLITIPRVGHMAPVTEPESIAPIVLERLGFREHATDTNAASAPAPNGRALSALPHWDDPLGSHHTFKHATGEVPHGDVAT